MNMTSFVLAGVLAIATTVPIVSILVQQQSQTYWQLNLLQHRIFEAMSFKLSDSMGTSGCLSTPADNTINDLIANNLLPSHILSSVPWSMSISYERPTLGELVILTLTLTANSEEDGERLRQSATPDLLWKYDPSTLSLTLRRDLAFIAHPYDELAFDFDSGCFDE